MGVSIGSSIYNAPSIYESGAGGGGGDLEGDFGAGSISMPEGFTRLLYIENNKISNIFRCNFDNLSISFDDDFLFSFKSPLFISDGDSFRPIGSNNTLNVGMRKRSYIGDKTRFEGGGNNFFYYAFEGNTNLDLSNVIIDLKMNKDGLYINDEKIFNFAGPFDQSTRQQVYFPYQLGVDQKSSICQCYKFVIKNGDSIKYDFIPAKNENNDVGFLDLVNENFYAALNAIAGPDFPY